MADYEFTLPWPPTVNHWHQPVRMGRGVRVVKSTKARNYESKAVAECAKIGIYGELTTGKLDVELELNPPTLAKYDIDNRTKGVFDSLSAAKFWDDDEQVSKLTINKGEKVKGGNVKVKVWLRT